MSTCAKLTGYICNGIAGPLDNIDVFMRSNNVSFNYLVNLTYTDDVFVKAYPILSW